MDADFNQNEVAERIKGYIEMDCSTPAAFAKIAGIDPSNFMKMLSGKQKISAGTLKKIASAHGLRLEYLQTGVGDMFTEKIVGVSGSSNNNNNVTHNSDDVIKGLMAQLAEKDRQLAEKDKQINQLLKIISEK